MDSRSTLTGAWCEHTFGEEYPTIRTEQRAWWEDVYGITLNSLQLSIVQGNGKIPNSITNASKDVSKKLAKNPKGGNESTDDGNDGNDGNDIEVFDVLHLGDDSDSEVDLL